MRSLLGVDEVKSSHTCVIMVGKSTSTESVFEKADGHWVEIKSKECASLDLLGWDVGSSPMAVMLRFQASLSVCG